MATESIRTEGVVLGLPAGVKFQTADVHTPSFGASHDVKDPTLMAERILETAKHENFH